MIKTNNILLILILEIILHQHSFAQDFSNDADAIIGYWLMPESEGILEIFKINNIYNGKIIWMLEKENDGSPLKDKENPVDSLRMRNILGLEIMLGFKYSGDNLWSGGTFYAAKKGKIVEPDLILVDNNKLSIEISFILFSKTIELTRIDKPNLKLYHKK